MNVQILRSTDPILSQFLWSGDNGITGDPVSIEFAAWMILAPYSTLPPTSLLEGNAQHRLTQGLNRS
jgi:hypothetical protein